MAGVVSFCEKHGRDARERPHTGRKTKGAAGLRLKSRALRSIRAAANRKHNPPRSRGRKRVQGLKEKAGKPTLVSSRRSINEGTSTASSSSISWLWREASHRKDVSSCVTRFNGNIAAEK